MFSAFFLFLLAFSGVNLMAQTNWTNAAAVSPNAGSDSEDDEIPRPASDGNGNWVVIWESEDTLSNTVGTDVDIFAAYSHDDGNSWSGPVVINSFATTDDVDDARPWVEAKGNGTWIAVWESRQNIGGLLGDDVDVLISRSTDNGITWSDAAALAPNAGADGGSQDLAPCVAYNGNGTWLAYWYNTLDEAGSGPEPDLMVCRSTDGVSWTGPAYLNSNALTDTGADFNPHMDGDATGTWIATWLSNDVLDANLGTDNDIFFTRSTDDGLTWSTVAALNTNAPEDSGQDLYPRITTDGMGNWGTVWQSDENLGGLGLFEDIFFSRSTDNGASWSTPIAINSNGENDYRDQAPTIAFGGGEELVVTWFSDDWLGGTVLTDFDVFSTYSQDFGQSWSDLVVINDFAHLDSSADAYPEIASDGNGKYLTAWYSSRNISGIGPDFDVLFALSPAPCQLSSTFFDGVAAWSPTDTVLDLVGVVNSECGP